MDLYDPDSLGRIGLAGSHAALFEERSHIGAAATAGFAGELGFQVRQSDVIRPETGTNHDRMRAFEIAAVDDQQARAVVGSRFSEGDFLLALHAAL
jgi:hypothetical protein